MKYFFALFIVSYVCEFISCFLWPSITEISSSFIFIANQTYQESISLVIFIIGVLGILVILLWEIYFIFKTSKKIFKKEKQETKASTMIFIFVFLLFCLVFYNSSLHFE